MNDPGSYHCSCSAYHIIHPRNPHLCILGLSNEEDNLTEDTNYGLLMSTGRQNYIDPVCRGQVSYLGMFSSFEVFFEGYHFDAKTALNV